MSTLRLVEERRVVQATARMQSGLPAPKLVVAPPDAKKCLNCDALLATKFCGHCGQPAKTKRFLFHDFLHELPHALLHLEHALPHTLKALLTKPGPTIRAYLEGRRTNIFSPVQLFFMLAGLMAVVKVATEETPAAKVAATSDAIAEFGHHKVDIVKLVTSAGDFLKHYRHWMQLLLLPADAWLPWLFLRKRTRLGFAEHVIAATMVAVGMEAIGLAFAPAMWALKGHAVWANRVSWLRGVLVFAYEVWAYAGLQKDERGRWSRGLAAAIGFNTGAPVFVVLVGVPAFTSLTLWLAFIFATH